MIVRLLRSSPCAAFALWLCVGVAPAAAAPAAPSPAQSVDKDRLYIGVWHEIARTHSRDTDGCVDPETRFTTNDDGVLMDRETCRQGDPNTGKLRVLSDSALTLPDPNSPAKFRTSHSVLFIPVGRESWVLDHDESYTWFIAANPAFTDLSIYVRDPQTPQAVRDGLVDRAKALGFDVSKLEFPAQPER